MQELPPAFWLRRLHSLTGIIPLGAFLVQHMMGNAIAVLGQEEYDHHVELLTGLPFLLLIEVATIFGPLAFHALLGIYYTFKSSWNPLLYNYERNWAYVLQRVTGIIALIFVVVHLLGTRFSFDADQKANMHDSMVLYFQTSPWLAVFYVLGAVAASFHFCNGLWSFCIMWGITITRKSQDLVFKAAMGLFLAMSAGFLLSVLVLAGWLGFAKDVVEEREKNEREGKVASVDPADTGATVSTDITAFVPATVPAR